LNKAAKKRLTKYAQYDILKICGQLITRQKLFYKRLIKQAEDLIDKYPEILEEKDA